MSVEKRLMKGQKAICGAKTRGGTACRRIPMPNGRCKLHGGMSTGAKDKSVYKGNTRAMTHGANESIFARFFKNPEDRERFENINTDTVHQLREEIKLLTYREIAMMERIDNLREQAFTVVEITHAAGVDKDKDVDLTTEKRAATLGQIMVIEAELTKIQEKKQKAIDLKHKIETSGGAASGKASVESYVDALEGKAADVWDDEEADES